MLNSILANIIAGLRLFFSGLRMVDANLRQATGRQLRTITEDRGEFVERARQEYLADEATVSATDRAVLLQVTSVFERAVWMTQRLARLIETGRRGRATAFAWATAHGSTGATHDMAAPSLERPGVQAHRSHPG